MYVLFAMPVSAHEEPAGKWQVIREHRDQKHECLVGYSAPYCYRMSDRRKGWSAQVIETYREKREKRRRHQYYDKKRY